MIEHSAARAALGLPGVASQGDGFTSAFASAARLIIPASTSARAQRFCRLRTASRALLRLAHPRTPAPTACDAGARATAAAMSSHAPLRTRGSSSRAPGRPAVLCRAAASSSAPHRAAASVQRYVRHATQQLRSRVSDTAENIGHKCVSPPRRLSPAWHPLSPLPALRLLGGPGGGPYWRSARLHALRRSLLAKRLNMMPYGRIREADMRVVVLHHLGPAAAARRPFDIAQLALLAAFRSMYPACSSGERTSGACRLEDGRVLLLFRLAQRSCTSIVFMCSPADRLPGVITS